MARTFPSLLKGTITQLSNDADVWGTIQTGIGSRSNTGYLIKRIEIELEVNKIAPMTAASVYYRTSIYKGGPGTNYTPELDNSRVIMNWSWACPQRAFASAGQIMGTYIWDAPPGTWIADEEISVTLNSWQTAQKNRMSFRIFYTKAELTPGQIIQLRTW